MRTQRSVCALVSGQVQGVFYRFSLQHEARARGLKGWVRNLRDRRVEFLAQGDADAVRTLLDWSRKGPPDARVVEVDVREVPFEPELRRFEIRF